MKKNQKLKESQYDRLDLIKSCAIQDHLSKNLKNNLIQLPKIHTQKSKTFESIHQKRKIQKLHKINYKNEEVDDIVKMHKYKSKLSLGQRLGIYPCPDPPLSSDDWAKIEMMSKKRDESVCAICLEAFKNQDQVILSCSHVFHQNCLVSFEKFIKVKQCPICRKESYEKKKYKHNQEIYYINQVIIIQKWIRGYLCRVLFYEMMISKPTNQILSLRLRRRVIGYKLSKISNKQTQSDRSHNHQITSLINNIDKQRHKFNQVLEKDLVEAQIQRNINQRGIQDLLRLKNNQNNQQEEKGVEWQNILTKIKTMDIQNEQCSICLNLLLNKKSIYVLDCCHCFHVHCLNAFERYSGNVSPQCPICRHQYQKRQLVLHQ